MARTPEHETEYQGRNRATLHKAKHSKPGSSLLPPQDQSKPFTYRTNPEICTVKYMGAVVEWLTPFGIDPTSHNDEQHSLSCENTVCWAGVSDWQKPSQNGRV